MSGRFSTYLLALALVGACLDTSAYSQTATGQKPKKVLALHVVRRDSPNFDDTFRAGLNEALSGQLDYYSE